MQTRLIQWIADEKGEERSWGGGGLVQRVTKGCPKIFLSVIVVCYYSTKPGKYRCIMLFQFVLLRLTNSFGDGRGRDIRKKGKKSTDLYDILLMFSFN